MEKKTVIIEVQTEDGVKQLDRLSAKFDEVYGDVLPLTASIGELEDQLYQMALEGKKGTEEFNLLAQEAGRLKKTLQQVDLEVDGLSMTTANKLGGALGGVTAGFELVQGAMGAMGVESEKVQEALLKVQSAMAIAQGVQGLKESVPVFKAIGAAGKAAFTGIRGAILATGIGALIVGVGLLISNWDKVTSVTKKAWDASKSMVSDFSTKYPKTAKAIKTYLEWAFMPIILAYKGAMMLYDALSGTTEASRKAAAVAEANHKKHMKQLDDEQKARDENLKGLDRKIALLEAEGKSTIKLREEKIKLQKQEAEANLAFAEYMKGRMQGNEIFEQSFTDMVSAAKDSLNGIEVEEAKLAKEKRDINKQNTDNYKEKLKEQKDALAEKNAEELEKYKERLEQERAMQEAEDNWKASYDLEIKTKEQEAADKQRQDDEEASAFKIKLWEYEAAESKRLEEEKIANKKKAIKASIDLTQQSLSVIGDLVDTFAGKDEASQKRAFKIKKVASIASATIDTYKGATSAFADTPGGVLIKSIAAGIALTAGLAKVKAIASTQFEGGGGASASGGGSPNLPQSQPAQFNIVGNSGTNQLAGAEGGGVMKAYVVSGEVTSAQSLERNKIVTATL
jgi:hypothetical protein